MAETTSDITQAFVDELLAMKESNQIKESIISFEDFTSKKSSIPEGFDAKAFTAAAEGKAKSKASSSGSKTGASLPFTNKEEGDAFRKWVNDTHEEWAKENKLDPSGSYNNSYIKKAWNEFGEDYKKETELPKTESGETLPVEYKPLYDVLAKYNEGSSEKFLSLRKATSDNKIFKPGDIYIKLISKNYPIKYEFNTTQNKWGCWEYPNYPDENGKFSGKSSNVGWGSFSELGKKVKLEWPTKKEKEKDEISLNNFYQLTTFDPGYKVGDIESVSEDKVEGLDFLSWFGFGDEKYDDKAFIKVNIIKDDRPASSKIKEKDIIVIRGS